MHAFLLVGNNLEEDIKKLSKKLNAKILPYPLAKIEDVRNLNNLIRLSFDSPTLIVSENIHETGTEALNAFLKNLEEPQENIYFALTAPSVRKVLPTIVSRSQIIKSTNKPINQLTNKPEIEEFLKMSIGEKLALAEKIKDREKAIELVVNSVNFLHSQLHKNGVQYSSTVDKINKATETLTRLKANGNVNLQLTNLVINL
jgi:DNA polymerase III delta prime subunit